MGVFTFDADVPLFRVCRYEEGFLDLCREE